MYVNTVMGSFRLIDKQPSDSRISVVLLLLQDIIGMGTLGDDLRPTRIVGPNVGYSLFVWICIWACLAFGLKWTGRIAYVSMGLPILLLFVFLIKACTLEGAEDGIKAYIGVWDMSVLKDRPDVWSTAVSQIFFSLSVTFGTMTAYGSGCPRGEPAFTNSMVIGLSNSMFSFISGFAVFAAMGHLAWQQGIPVDDVPYAGFSLVFGTWPIVFGSLPGGEHWVRLLFFDLFLLGIDSAFSILEGPLTVAMDRVGMEGYPKWKGAAAFSFVAYLLSLLYATDAGLIFLDTIDWYINFVLLLTGFFETFGAGWVYHLEEQVTKLGAEIVFTYMFTHFGSVIVACGLWFGLKSNAVWGGFLGLFLCYFAGFAVTYMLLKKKMAQEPEWTWRSIMYELCLKNVMDLRGELSEVVGYIPYMWAFGLKNFIPHILLLLFINLASSDNAEGDPLFGNYSGYIDWPFQVLGILCVAFAAFLILVGIAMPVIYEPYDIPYNKSLQAAKAPQKELESLETGDKKDESSGEEGEEVAEPEAEVEAEA
jgi:solute carrier family 6 GABA transporter-like protein 1